MPLAIPYPDWIRPEIIPGFPFLRWYGLMYLVAFATAFLLFRKQARLGELARAEGRSTGPTEDEMISFFTWGIAGLLLGARVFSTLVYEPTGIYIARPWLIFWPFDAQMRWTGLGGCRTTAASSAVSWAWCSGAAGTEVLPRLVRRDGRVPSLAHLRPPRQLPQRRALRRVTTSPVGMVFPSAPRFDATLEWVNQVAREVGS
jgi:phosphatidylglycerol:prolipoprotein diacylglycerol transferase